MFCFGQFCDLYYIYSWLITLYNYNYICVYIIIVNIQSRVSLILYVSSSEIDFQFEIPFWSRISCFKTQPRDTTNWAAAAERHGPWVYSLGRRGEVSFSAPPSPKGLRPRRSASSGDMVTPTCDGTNRWPMFGSKNDSHDEENGGSLMFFSYWKYHINEA